MTDTDLDARAARAMGWTKSESGVYWVDPSVGPIKPIGWHPTHDENHFAEMLREIERKGCEMTFFAGLLERAGDGMTAFFAPLPTRVLAACEALEATR